MVALKSKRGHKRTYLAARYKEDTLAYQQLSLQVTLQCPTLIMVPLQSNVS